MVSKGLHLLRHRWCYYPYPWSLSLSISLFARAPSVLSFFLGLTLRCTLYNVPCATSCVFGRFSFFSLGYTPKILWEVPSHRYTRTHRPRRFVVVASPLLFFSPFRIVVVRSRIFIFSQSPWAGATVKMCAACRLWKPWLFPYIFYFSFHISLNLFTRSSFVCSFVRLVWIINS